MSTTTDALVLPFGRHRGKRLDELDDAYVDWLATAATIQEPDLREAVRKEHHRRTTLARWLRPAAAAIVEAGFLEMDGRVEGDDEKRRRLRAAHDWLRRLIGRDP